MFKLFDRQPRRKETPGKEALGATGTVTVKLYDRSGDLKAVRGPMRNTIVQIGRSYILQQLGSALTQSKSKRSCRWTGVGHAQTAAALTQIKLGTQRCRKRNKFTFVSGRNYYSCIATFTSLSGILKSTLYESALFWQSGTATSVMLARQTFSAVTKLSADTLTVEWRISIQ
jgi:hypothetical protein